MAITGTARRVWSKASSHWSWYRIPLNSSSPSFSHHLANLSPFSFDLSPIRSRFPTPLLFSPLNPSSFIPRSTSAHSRLYSPFNKWISGSGPLFLWSPTWQLSQLATPLSPPGKFIFRENEWEGDRRKESCQQRINAFVKKHLPDGAKVFVHVGRWQFSDAQPAQGVQLVPASFNGSPRLEISVSDAAGDFVNLPNAISISRMMAGPLLGWMILNELYFPAFVGLVFAGATDWLDGYVARKMKINSVLGSYLDPLADKVLIISVALSMIKSDLLSPALVALVVARDCALMGGAFYKRADSMGWEWKDWRDFFNVENDGAEKIEPLFISKVNTVLQLALVGLALLQPEIGTDNSLTVLTWLSWLVAATTLASWAGYGLLYFQKGSQTALRSPRILPARSKIVDSQLWLKRSEVYAAISDSTLRLKVHRK